MVSSGAKHSLELFLPLHASNLARELLLHMVLQGARLWDRLGRKGRWWEYRAWMTDA